jgi:hypothetical protein
MVIIPSGQQMFNGVELNPTLHVHWAAQQRLMSGDGQFRCISVSLHTHTHTAQCRLCQLYNNNPFLYIIIIRSAVESFHPSFVYSHVNFRGVFEVSSGGFWMRPSFITSASIDAKNIYTWNRVCICCCCSTGNGNIIIN